MILITGATGTTGAEIVRQLAAAGHPVRALVRNPAKASEALGGLKIEIVEGDLDQPASLSAGLRGADRALLLPANSLQQVEQEHNFIRAARRAGVRHIVKYSVIGASSLSPARICRWHSEAEKFVEHSGLTFTHLRPNFFMQNLLWLAGPIRGANAFSLPLGSGRTSMVDTRDIAAVAAAVLTGAGHEGETYTITGPEALSFQQVAAKLSAAIGRDVTYNDIAPEEFKRAYLATGQPEWSVDALLEIYREIREDHFSEVTDSILKVTGLRPRSFDDFSRDHAAAFGAGAPPS